MFSWKVTQIVTVFSLRSAALSAAVFCLCNSAVAQQAVSESSVAYRLPDEHTMHFDDPQKSADHLQAVQKLGCEVTPSEHAGHGDVAYRCRNWKALTVANDELAHQWEEWLEAAGFETLHGHPENEANEDGGEHAHEHSHEGAEHEEVSYRLQEWVTFNPPQPSDADEMIAIAKGLGCEVQESRQGAAVSISVRCMEPKHIECSSHEAAEFWQQWLTKTGFETRHDE